MARLPTLKWPAWIIMLLLCQVANSNEMVVVVNQNNPTSALSKTQVIDLYMGKYVAFPDGTKAVPVDLDDNSTTQAIFYETLVGMPLARVNAYWSRVKFSGRARPPMKIHSEQATINFVLENENAIAYVYESSVTDGLKVVYRFNE